MGTLFPRVDLPGHEADHPSPTSAKVKNGRSCTFTPLYIFMVQCLVKHRDIFFHIKQFCRAKEHIIVDETILPTV
jgi:hypothetical protein